MSSGYRTTFRSRSERRLVGIKLVERTAPWRPLTAPKGIRWTFAPWVDIARDPAAGDASWKATAGSYLGAIYAGVRPRISGSDHRDPPRSSPAQNYCVDTAGREAGITTRSISRNGCSRDVYLPEGAQERRRGDFHGSFQRAQRSSRAANHFTLTTAPGEWGFRGGLLLSRLDLHRELIPSALPDGRTAAFKTFAAGVDMDMQANLYATHLVGLVREGRLDGDR